MSNTERFVRHACAKLLTSGSIKDGGFGHEFHSKTTGWNKSQDFGLKVNTVTMFSINKLKFTSKDKPITFCFKPMQVPVKSKMADYYFFIFLSFLKLSLKYLNNLIISDFLVLI